jgi:hypothetical protein
MALPTILVFHSYDSFVYNNFQAGGLDSITTCLVSLAMVATEVAPFDMKLKFYDLISTEVLHGEVRS